MPTVITFRLPGVTKEFLPGEEVWIKVLDQPPQSTTLRALYDIIQSIEVRGLSWSYSKAGPWTPTAEVVAVMMTREWTAEEKKERILLKSWGVPQSRISDIVLEYGCGEKAAASEPRRMMLEDVLDSVDCK